MSFFLVGRGENAVSLISYTWYVPVGSLTCISEMQFGNKTKHEHPREFDDALYKEEKSRVGTLWSALGKGTRSVSPDVRLRLGAGVCCSAAALAHHHPCANSLGLAHPAAPTL